MHNSPWLEVPLVRKCDPKTKEQAGLSVLEVVVVVTIILIVAGLVLPNVVQAWYDISLRSDAAEVADLMQRARMQAARSNSTIPIRYQVTNGVQQVYADVNNNGALDVNLGEPVIDIPRITAAAAAPNGSGGQPTAFVDSMDTTSGTPCDNTCTLAFSPRGLPCNYISGTPATCTTPSASYFVYYFTDGRPTGWGAVLVSKTGRTKTLLWNGSSWH
jgi:Tfp pilus assembly protein FimT